MKSNKSANIYTFRVIIEPDGKNAYHGYVPSLPGCHTCGRTIEETKKNLKDAISCYVASLINDNEPVPNETGMEFFQTVTETDLKETIKCGN